MAPTREEVLANNEREKRRCAQCAARVNSCCAAINVEVGWTLGLNLDDCDRCWGLGPASDKAAAFRGSLAHNTVQSLIDKAKLRGMPSDVVQVMLTRHVPRDLAAEWMSDPSFLMDVTKKERWASVRSTWAMADSFVRSMGSRGLFNRKTDPATKSQRHVACTGLTIEGKGVSVQCPSYTISEDAAHHYCNDCGCGDTTLARIDGPGYTKLDYPHLECPRRRPGFSNEMPAPSAGSEGEELGA